jgi:hypothetical protein
MLSTYLVTFALAMWPIIGHIPVQNREMRAVADEIAGTDASPWEALRLMNIAAVESGFSRNAVGKLGERGAFQVMGTKHDAREALRRLRTQGLAGYMGCGRFDCSAIIAKHVDRADLFYMAFSPLASSVAPMLEPARESEELAQKP